MQMVSFIIYTVIHVYTNDNSNKIINTHFIFKTEIITVSADIRTQISSTRGSGQLIPYLKQIGTDFSTTASVETLWLE